MIFANFRYACVLDVASGALVGPFDLGPQLLLDLRREVAQERSQTTMMPHRLLSVVMVLPIQFDFDFSSPSHPSQPLWHKGFLCFSKASQTSSVTFTNSLGSV
jgi:hypothetical protein